MGLHWHIVCAYYIRDCHTALYWLAHYSNSSIIANVFILIKLFTPEMHCWLCIETSWCSTTIILSRKPQLYPLLVVIRSSLYGIQSLKASKILPYRDPSYASIPFDLSCTLRTSFWTHHRLSGWHVRPPCMVTLTNGRCDFPGYSDPTQGNHQTVMHLYMVTLTLYTWPARPTMVNPGPIAWRNVSLEKWNNVRLYVRVSMKVLDG